MVFAENKRNRSRVVVGLSGGVDSAVAAALLQEQGFEVHGVALKLWKVTEVREESPPAVSTIAASLGIPWVEREMKAQFYDQVVEPFISAYAAGETPNPCVFCNPTLKFATLLEEADRLDAYWIATGHYARVHHCEDGTAHLLRARAVQKDQSYALYRLTQRYLQRLKLPLGDLESKDDVREKARMRHLPSAKAAESQDLCFMAGTDYRSLLTAVRPEALTPGPIYDEAGTELGEHSGLAGYTVGQRSGLGIASTERLYVLELDPARNALVVGPRSRLTRRTCTLNYLSFIENGPPAQSFAAAGRIRYHAPLTSIQVTLTGEDEARVTFETPQFGVAPGQSLVIYDGDRVVGGGVIVADAVPNLSSHPKE